MVMAHLNKAEVEAGSRDHKEINRNEKEESQTLGIFLTDAQASGPGKTRVRNTCQGVQKESDQPRVCEPCLELGQPERDKEQAVMDYANAASAEGLKTKSLPWGMVPSKTKVYCPMASVRACKFACNWAVN
jgi:hypothetical protein